MTQEKYKALFLPAGLHNEVKIAATKNNLTMMDFIEILLHDFNLKGVVMHNLIGEKYPNENTKLRK